MFTGLLGILRCMCTKLQGRTVSVISPCYDGRWHEFFYTVVDVVPVCQDALSPLLNLSWCLRAPGAP